MKKDVDRLSTYLVSQGFSAKGLHGDMEQRQREEVIKAFKNDTLEVLVATDVAARGLDVKDVSHVFNYQLPFDSESYVHRIGRTGRGGKEGKAISIVTPAEFRSLHKIQKDVGANIQNKQIPNKASVKKQAIEKLKADILSKTIDENVYELVEQLKENLDLSSITYKLASMLLDQSQISGKDKIGKSKKDIEFLLKRAKESSSSRNRNKSNRNRSRNINNKYSHNSRNQRGRR
jgi:ATP-dependent RNA helicase DeaD